MSTGKIAIANRFANVAPDPCLICGGCEHHLLYEATYTGSAEQAVKYFLAHRTATAHGGIVRCRNCGFVFTSPRFNEGEYDKIYKSVRPPVALDPSFEKAKRARYDHLARIVRKHQPIESPLLDFGCSDGLFLSVLGSPAARGFEIGTEGRRWVGGSEIVTGDWAKVACGPVFPASSFDVVVAFDVLEHLPRLGQDLSLIRAVLKPGGLFLASVPNIESWAAKLMGSHWTMLLLEHLWYFSPATFNRYLAWQGFEMIEWRGLLFQAPLAHLFTRLAQTVGMKGTIKVGPLSRAVLPIPAGLMLGVFRRTRAI